MKAPEVPVEVHQSVGDPAGKPPGEDPRGRGGVILAASVSFLAGSPT